MKKILLCIILLTIPIFFLLKNHNQYDFNLRSQFSEETRLKHFQGKKLIVYFGYTFCPDVCPVVLSLVGKKLKMIGEDSAHILFISLDISRDANLSLTNEWLRYFYPNADALLAKDDASLKKLAKKYGIKYKKIELDDTFVQYTIAHSNELFLLDERGRLQKIIRDLSSQELLRELREFLTMSSKEIG